MPIKNENETISELVFFGVYGLHLRWTKQSFFSYLEKPRPNHGLMYLLCDGIDIEYKDGSADTFKKGNIIYIPEGINYKVKFFGDTDRLEALLINFSLLGEFDKKERIVKVTDCASKYCIDDVYSIISLYTQNRNYKYAVMSRFYHLLEELESNTESKQRESEYYRSILPAISYIDSHVNEVLRIPHLATLCLLSETVFRKRFKKETGKSPSKYILDLKLEKACELLKKEDIQISAIVSELNFYDSAYFNKLFLKKYGITPAKFKKAT